MADELMTLDDMTDGKLDLTTLKVYINGDENVVNEPRLAPGFNVGSLAALNKHVKDKVDLQIATLPSGRKGYATLADAQAAQASLPANTLVDVTNDTTTANNGVYLWNGATLTKSVYDPLTQAKNYTEQYFSEKIVENLYKPTRVLKDYYASYADGSLQPYSGAVVAIIPVVAGQEYFIKSNNFMGAFVVSLNEYAYYTSTTLGTVTLIDTEHPKTKKFTVPIGSTAKFMYINIYLDVQNYDIRDSLVVSKTVGVSEINGFEIIDLQARKAGVTLTTSANIYDKSTMIVDNFYLDGNHVIDYATKWKIASIPVTPGNRVKITSNNYGYPFKAAFFTDNSYASGKTPVSKVLDKIGTAYYGTVPSNAKFLVVIIYSGDGSFDITDSLIVTSVVTQSATEITSINNMPIADLYARSRLDISSRLKDAKVFAFGDSITEGTHGGYIKHVEAILGTTITNYASSGSRASRLADIVLSGNGLPKRDAATANIDWGGLKDFANAKAITIQIGTNDLADNNWGDVSQLPTAKLSDYANPLDYWALFANNFIGNVSLVIEYIKSKNDKCEIYLVTSPYANNATANAPSFTAKLFDYYKPISERYSIPLINAMQRSGIGFKDMAANYRYSYDGTHFNTLGNELWGRYIGLAVLAGN